MIFTFEFHNLIRNNNNALNQVMRASIYKMQLSNFILGDEAGTHV